MNDGLIPMRYAKAIYEVACEKGCAQPMYTLMKELLDRFAEQPSLYEVLANPYVAVDDKMALLLTASAASGVPDAFLKDVYKLLASNRRIDMTRDIAAAYVKLYRKVNHISEVKITSASPMGEKEAKRLTSLIEKHLNGATMETSWAVDPSLIGGFSVSIDNERIDASVSNELKQMRLNLIKK